MKNNELNLSVLADKIKSEVNSGIFFNLQGSKTILEVVSVLNFLKYKIKKWGLSTIFSYKGMLFDFDTIIVIGAKNVDQALKIIASVYLEKLIEFKSEASWNEWEEKMQIFSIDSVREEISSNIKTGIPDNIEIELNLQSHLEEILSEDFFNSLSSNIK